jgi:Flp pilus assembly protein TadD
MLAATLAAAALLAGLVCAGLAHADPAPAEDFALLGRLYAEQGREQEAETALEQARLLESEDPFVYFWLGRRQSSPQRLLEAVGRVVRRRGLLDAAAMQALSGASKPDPDAAAEAERLRLELEGLFRESLRLLRQLENATLYERDLRRLIAWFPSSRELKTALGRHLADEERWGEAAGQWQGLLRTDPQVAEAQLGLAIALERLGRGEEAALAFLRAVELDPRSPAIYDGLVRAYAGREQELHTLLSDRALRDTRNPVLFRRLAWLERRLGLEQAAAEHLLRAERLEAEP